MITYREFTRRALTTIILIAIVALLLLGLKQVTNLVLLLFSAWVLAVTLEVPVHWLQQHRIPRLVAVLITIVGLLMLVTLIISVIVPPFVEQIDALLSGLPDFILNAVRNYSRLRISSSLATRVLPPINVQYVEEIVRGDLTQLFPLFSELGQSLSNGTFDFEGLAGTALPVLRQIGSFLTSFIANLVLLLLLILLLLLEPVAYYRAFVSLMPVRYEARALEVINKVREKVISWLGAMLLSTGVTTGLYFVVLGMIQGLPNALALSVLAGVATFIPTFGPIIAIIPVMIVAAAEGLPKLIVTVILYAAVGAVQDRVVTPLVMKSELDIPAAGLVVFQLALATIIGPVGLLLAVPILAITITLVHELYVRDVLGKREKAAAIAVTAGGALALKAAPAETDIEVAFVADIPEEREEAEAVEPETTTPAG